MLFVQASLVKDAENTTLGFTDIFILQVTVKTMSNAACAEPYSSRITNNMICAAAPGKDACQVAICNKLLWITMT